MLRTRTEIVDPLNRTLHRWNRLSGIRPIICPQVLKPMLVTLSVVALIVGGCPRTPARGKEGDPCSAASCQDGLACENGKCSKITQATMRRIVTCDDAAEHLLSLMTRAPELRTATTEEPALTEYMLKDIEQDFRHDCTRYKWTGSERECVIAAPTMEKAYGCVSDGGRLRH
jgi:hypothetical protein